MRFVKPVLCLAMLAIGIFMLLTGVFRGLFESRVEGLLYMILGTTGLDEA